MEMEEREEEENNNRAQINLDTNRLFTIYVWAFFFLYSKKITICFLNSKN